jgi:hypothetical protein
MNRLRATRISAWIALLAMSWALLAPAVSRALAVRSSDAAAWAEVCSAASSPQAGPSDTEPDGAARLHRALNHCPLCTLSLDKLAPPCASFAWAVKRLPQVLAAQPMPLAPVSFRQFQPPVRGPPALPTVTFRV